MLEWGGPAAQRLAEAAVKIAKRMSHFKESSTEGRQWIVRMWANVTPAGGLNLLHSHPGNLWAAVLYIDMGHEKEQDPGDAGGNFYLEDPRFPMAAMRDTAFRIRGNRRPASAVPDRNSTPARESHLVSGMAAAWSSNTYRKWRTDYYRNEYRRREQRRESISWWGARVVRSPSRRKSAEGDRTNQELVRSCRGRSSKAIANKRIE